MAILQAVMQKFSRKTDIVPPPAHRAINDFAERINRYAALFALQEQKQFIEVKCESSGKVYQSLILAIDLVNGHLQIDELFPHVTNDYQVGDMLTVRHHYRGQLLSFTTPLLATEFSSEGSIYTLKLPPAAVYRQRRRNTRINLSQQQPLTVQMQSPWRSPWYAIARNLSTGGMRFTVGGNVMEQLQPGGLIPLCEFKFGPDITIRCQGIVRSFRFNRRPYRHTEISMEFTDMAPAQQLQLEQIINALATASTQAA